MDVSRILVLSASIVLLAACASTSGGNYAGRSVSKSQVGAVDLDYMYRVEQAAAQTGVEVHWVNPPKPRKSDSDD